MTDWQQVVQSRDGTLHEDHIRAKAHQALLKLGVMVTPLSSLIVQQRAMQQCATVVSVVFC
jgi:hypothetical protein